MKKGFSDHSEIGIFILWAILSTLGAGLIVSKIHGSIVLLVVAAFLSTTKHIMEVAIQKYATQEKVRK